MFLSHDIGLQRVPALIIFRRMFWKVFTKWIWRQETGVVFLRALRLRLSHDLSFFKVKWYWRLSHLEKSDDKVVNRAYTLVWCQFTLALKSFKSYYTYYKWQCIRWASIFIIWYTDTKSARIKFKKNLLQDTVNCVYKINLELRSRGYASPCIRRHLFVSFFYLTSNFLIKVTEQVDDKVSTLM